MPTKARAASRLYRLVKWRCERAVEDSYATMLMSRVGRAGSSLLIGFVTAIMRGLNSTLTRRAGLFLLPVELVAAAAAEQTGDVRGRTRNNKFKNKTPRRRDRRRLDLARLARVGKLDEPLFIPMTQQRPPLPGHVVL